LFVKDAMTPNPLTVQPTNSVRTVLKVMRDTGFEALPVTEDGQLVGIVTAWDLLMALAGDEGSPEAARETKVGDIMARDVVSVNPGDIIEEAACLMRRHDVSALPVLDESQRLVGIVTESDIYGVLVDMLGLREPGTRITLRVPDRVGILADITQIIKQCGVSIASLATFEPREQGRGNVVVRVKTREGRQIVDKLMEAGHRVTHVSLVWEDAVVD